MSSSRSSVLTTVGMVLVSALGIVAVACGDDGGTLSLRDTASSGASEQNRSLNSGKGLPASAATSTSGQPQAPAVVGKTGSSAPGTGTAGSVTSLDRKIIMNAKLDLEATDVRASFNDVTRVARAAGGFVERSSLDERPLGVDKTVLHGTISLRVPSAKYGDVVADLQTLSGVKVTKEQSSSNEVTEQYTDLTSRQRNLERSEAQYLKLYEQAKTIQEILTVQERLDGVRLQIEQIQGKVKVLDDLTQLATIDITLTPPPPAKVLADDGPKGVTESFVDAWNGSMVAAQQVAAFGAAVAAVLVWTGLPLVLAASGIGIWQRRNRPSAGI